MILRWYGFDSAMFVLVGDLVVVCLLSRLLLTLGLLFSVGYLFVLFCCLVIWLVYCLMLVGV